MPSAMFKFLDANGVQIGDTQQVPVTETAEVPEGTATVQVVRVSEEESR